MMTSNQGSTFFLSNDLSFLADELKRNLFFSNKNPFLKRIIVTLNPAVMKDWIVQRCLNDPNLASFLSCEFLSYTEAFFYILRLSGEKKLFFSKEEFFFWIVEEMNAVDQISMQFPELVNYVQNGSSKQMYALAEELSELYMRYCLYGDFDLSNTVWQERFLERFLERKGVTKEQIFPNNIHLISKKLELHFFHMNYLPEKYFSFFANLSEQIGITHYLFSPTNIFWSDLVTKKEERFLEKKFTKNALSKSSISNWKEYQKNSHPLLTNFGKLARKYLHTIEKYDFAIVEHYNEKTPETLLEKVQQSFFSDEWDFSEKDLSIQLIKAGNSKLREVEILKETIINLLHNNPSLKPNDILCLAPNISEYAPYIHFSFTNTHLRYQINEGIAEKSSFSRALEALIKLLYSDWNQDDLFALFSCSAFQKKFYVSSQDVEEFREFCDQSKIQFGFDTKAVDESSKCENKESFYPFTWQKSLEKHLMGLTFSIKDEHEFFTHFPTAYIEGIKFTDVKLLGSFYSVIEDLYTAITKIKDEKKRSLSEWVEIFVQFIDSFLQADDGSEAVRTSYFEKLHQVKELCEGSFFSLDTFYFYLKHLLIESRESISSTLSDCISFVSIKEGGITPSKIIYLMGMQDDAYPRKEVRSSLEFMTNFYPTSALKDRHLFLELLFACKERLIFSYCNQSSDDGKEQGYSFLLSELFHFIDDFSIGNRFETTNTINPPLTPFDKKLFSNELQHKSFDYQMYEVASIHYNKKKVEFSPIVFDLPGETTSPENELSLKNLFAFASDPLKFYINNSLGIYLEDKNDEREEFFLSALDRYKLCYDKGFTDLSREIFVEKIKGNIPIGLFESIAEDECLKRVNRLHYLLGEVGISHSEIETLTIEKNHSLTLPEIVLTGDIRHTTKSGLIFFKDYSYKELIKAWPKALIYLCCNEKTELDLFFLRQKIQKVHLKIASPKEELERYLCYYFSHSKKLSFIHPEWTKELFISDMDSCTKKIHGIIGSEQCKNTYFDWAFPNKKISIASELFNKWSSYAKTVYAGLIENDI